MEKNQVEIFFTLEEHMQQRYAYLIEKKNFSSYNVQGLSKLLGGVSLYKIFQRVYYRNLLEEEYRKALLWIDDQENFFNINKIYLSNSEGFIAHNFAVRLKKRFPKIKLIALQHGVFNVGVVPNKSFRNIINLLFNFLFNFYPMGVGFGGKIVDQYIVYNSLFKNYLVKQNGWNESDVKIDFEFLKMDLYDKRVPNVKEEGTVIFLLQCLASAKLCSNQEEEHLINSVIEYLSKKHTKVLIKEHPLFKNQKRGKLLENCSYANDLIDGFNRAQKAYSFTSTALLEAKIFDIDTYAINAKFVNVDETQYQFFENIISFEDKIERK